LDRSWSWNELHVEECVVLGSTMFASAFRRALVPGVGRAQAVETHFGLGGQIPPLMDRLGQERRTSIKKMRASTSNTG